MVNYQLIKQDDIVKYQDEGWLENHVIPSLESYFRDKNNGDVWECVQGYSSQDGGGWLLEIPDVTMPDDVDLIWQLYTK